MGEVKKNTPFLKPGCYRGLQAPEGANYWFPIPGKTGRGKSHNIEIIEAKIRRLLKGVIKGRYL